MPNTRKNPRDPDSPFITREGMRNAVPFRERFPNADLSKVTVVMTEEKEEIKLSLSKDIVTKLRATGPEWSSLAEEILRSGLKRRKKIAA
jgi:uncharacterized protein (DUF4415 family)